MKIAVKCRDYDDSGGAVCRLWSLYSTRWVLGRIRSEVGEGRTARSGRLPDGSYGMGKRISGSPGILGRDRGVWETGAKGGDVVDSGESRR